MLKTMNTKKTNQKNEHWSLGCESIPAKHFHPLSIYCGSSEGLIYVAGSGSGINVIGNDSKPKINW